VPEDWALSPASVAAQRTCRLGRRPDRMNTSWANCAGEARDGHGNAVVVMTAGASGLRFSLFAENGSDPCVMLKGQVERPHAQVVRVCVSDFAGRLLTEVRGRRRADRPRRAAHSRC
jgi:hypothetical protein